MAVPIASSHQSSLRKINDDARLRPFLSPLFDAQSYIKGVIKEGKSEDCFSTIVRCVEDINLEIKSYISQHKDDLMAGMQDVTALADRYTNLAAKSQKLHRNIQRLKQEALESNALVSSRTAELERIHSTSTLLHQLKAYVTAKAALDAFTKGGDDGGLRSLASAARTISELEKLLQGPQLLEVQLVAASAAEVRALGKSIRLLAQEKLAAAVLEKNQAAIASSLQVFFNLESLPEVLLLVVDSTVKRAVEASRAALDVERLHAVMTGETGATAHIPGSASKKPAAAAAPHGPGPAAGPGSASQVRIAVRELAHTWSSALMEHALQVHALQRVVAKKEDPTTHERFLAVLSRLDRPSHGSSAALESTALLARGQLVDLFWLRISDSLLDVTADKARHFSTASSRAYPLLRKVALEVLRSMQDWTEQGGFVSSRYAADDGANGAGDAAEGGSAGASYVGMFGSNLWSREDLLGSGAGAWGGWSLRERTAGAGGSGKHTSLSQKQREESQSGAAELREHSLVAGLRPLRDKYLHQALQRMSAPIAQMFPELEGYTAAVPSQRDMLALTKAMQAEALTAVQEGDPSLVTLLCKELAKTVQLMLSKVEGMVSVAPDTRTLSSANAFARTQSQAHNASLLVLLAQFKEALLKIPGQVASAAAADGSATLSGASKADRSVLAAAGADAVDRSVAVLLSTLRSCGENIEQLAQRQIMDPVVALLSSYVTSITVGLHKEGAVTLAAAASSPAPTPGTPAGNLGGYTGRAPQAAATPLDASAQECSATVQVLLRNLPPLLKSHLLNLPKCEAVALASNEIFARVLHSYVTVAALTRPVTEASRLRTAKDLAALEMLLSGLIAAAPSSTCPVMREYKAFRRLLFEQDGSRSGTAAATPAKTAPTSNPAPQAHELLRLPYIGHLRPSTLLGYLISCAPPQLPSPFEAAAGNGAVTAQEQLVAYVDDLTNTLSTPTVRRLYVEPGDSWRVVPNELRSWERVQAALDTFFQRITVAQGAQKQLLRQWYEVILDIGSKLMT